MDELCLTIELEEEEEVEVKVDDKTFAQVNISRLILTRILSGRPPCPMLIIKLISHLVS